MQPKDRHATATQHQHAVAGLASAIDHQRAPRSNSGGGQRRGLGVAITAGCVAGCLRIGNDRSARVAVDAVTWGGGETSMQRLTIQPLRKEGGNDMIAHCELLDLRPYRFHDAGTI